MKNIKIKLTTGREISKTQFYRLKKKAIELNCSIESIPDNRGKHNNHVSGKNHHRFNENKISTDGYKLIIVGVGHPLDIGNGYTYEHRYKMSLKIGRWIRSNEIVHHKDKNKLNNEDENLVLKSRSKHNQEHIKNDMVRDEITGRFIGFKKNRL